MRHGYLSVTILIATVVVWLLWVAGLSVVHIAVALAWLSAGYYAGSGRRNDHDRWIHLRAVRGVARLALLRTHEHRRARRAMKANSRDQSPPHEGGGF